MSLPFITQREQVTVTTYQRMFDRTDVAGAGFVFDCDPSGHVDTSKLAEAALVNLTKCLNGSYPVIDRGVQVYQHSYTEPASVRCDCYAQVWLEDAMYNECPKCGLGINGSGQRLAPVQQWAPDDQYAVFGPRNQPED